MQRRHMVVLLASTAIGGSNPLQASPIGDKDNPLDHVAWVIEVLKRMETIKPGMTRKDLSTVFTTEGGLSTRLHRTFVSQDCPLFKIDVEFRGIDSRYDQVESDEDIILKVSTPYLQFTILD